MENLFITCEGIVNFIDNKYSGKMKNNTIKDYSSSEHPKIEQRISESR